MGGGANGLNLAIEPDFALAGLSVSPSACRIVGGGQDLRVEAKTMAVLVVLARAGGGTVTRDELIEACWDGRVVSDDAIARTIAKVRHLARLVTPTPFTLETVPKVGYRLLAADVPNEIVATFGARSPNAGSMLPPRVAPHRLVGEQLFGAARRWTPALVVVAALAFTPMVWNAARGEGGYSAAVPRSPEVMDALMNLDEERLAVYVRRGWDPDWKLDSEGNTALHQVMMVCERNPVGHDKQAMLRVVRFLVEADADWTAQNGWGDTPLEIADTPRYCGADHPVVAYLSELAEDTPPQLVGVNPPPAPPPD